MSVRFGDVRLDVDARRLFRGSREIHLSPKAFELLQLLVEIRPRALSKADILERVWAGVFVSESRARLRLNPVPQCRTRREAATATCPTSARLA